MSDRDFPKYPCPERHQKIAIGALLLVLLLGFVAAIARAASTDATVCWKAPTSNTDGSSLTDLASYLVSFGKTKGGPYTLQTSVGASQTCVLIVPPSSGTWYFVVQAVNSKGAASASSSEGSKLIRPYAPTNGSIERTGASPSK